MNDKTELSPANVDFWDRVGLITSLLCIVHCTLTPILLFALPVLGAWFESPWVHALLALIVFPAGIFAFWAGYRLHKHRSILVAATIGFASLAIGLAVPDLKLEIIFTLIGGVCLSWAHWHNLRECRHCSHRTHS